MQEQKNSVLNDLPGTINVVGDNGSFTMFRVDSTMVSHVGYNQNAGSLVLRYNDAGKPGMVYEYMAQSFETFGHILSSPSVGGAIHADLFDEGARRTNYMRRFDIEEQAARQIEAFLGERASALTSAFDDGNVIAMPVSKLFGDTMLGAGDGLGNQVDNEPPSDRYPFAPFGYTTGGFPRACGEPGCTSCGGDSEAFAKMLGGEQQSETNAPRTFAELADFFEKKESRIPFASSIPTVPRWGCGDPNCLYCTPQDDNGGKV